jgi:hypothetical protein
MRNLGHEPCTARAAAMSARHIGLGPGLVDEDQAGWIKFALLPFPASPPLGDVGPILLAGVQAFF